MKLVCCDYCTQRANLSRWDTRLNSEILTKVTDLQGIISKMWSHPVLLTQKIMKELAPRAQTKLVKHTVDHLLEGWWPRLAGGNEQWQGVSSPARSSAPGTGGKTTDCLSPNQHPQHLFSHLTGNLPDTCWCERKAGQAHCYFAVTAWEMRSRWSPAEF